MVISKIKDVLKVQESLGELTKAVKEQTKVVRELSNDFDESKKEIKNHSKQIKELKNIQEKSLIELNKTIKDITISNQELKKEIDTFKLSKANLHNHAVNELKKSLKEVSDSLKNEKVDYNKAQKTINELTENISKSYDLFSKEIQRLINVSNKIKESDFELTKHAKNLDRYDNEKLKFIREIDKLETMIARMKRNRN
ncbi:hypothetical protein C0585_05680 [Candidatus Woesearchaeota archaeon]|nr:MAG: hypothetical protein C0585_05680 [Candidatus Woesearchaeota archaeon]